MIQTLPLVRELVERGEEVVYYSNERFEDEIKQTGAEYREYLGEYVDDPSDMIWNVHEFMPKVRDITKRELVNLRDIKPDYIIYDRNALWAPFLSEILDLCTVCTHSSIVLNRTVTRLHPTMKLLKMYRRRLHLLPQFFYSISAMRTMLKIKREFNFKGDINPITNADIILVNTSKKFQPFVESVPEAYKFIGWVPSHEFRTGGENFPWDDMKSGKLVYISLGTTFNRNNEFYELCFDLFGDMNYQVVISTGRGQKLDLPDKVPSNFILSEWVPQLDMLQRADVFVTQGGTSSVSESLNFGCPVVIVPQMAEQHILGYWAEKIKVGKHLEGGEISLTALKAAVETVISNPEYRENSEKIGDSFRNSGGVKYGVDEIFKLKERCGIS
jgi:MGT family glycosyltransferase